MTTNFASLLTNCPRISLAVYVGFNVVMTKPASDEPIKMIGYSGRFGNTMATTSPGFPPRRKRPLPNERARALASENL